MRLDTYLEMHYAVRSACKDANLRQAGFAIQRFSQWLRRPATIDDLTDQNVCGWLRDYGKRVAPSTVNAKRRYVLAIWRAARKDGLLSTDPRVPRVPECLDTPEAWTIDEMRAILSSTEALSGTVAHSDRWGNVRDDTGILASDWWRSIILVAYESGARISQLMAVECRDFDLDKRWLKLRAETAKERRARIVWLSEDTVFACREHWTPNRKLMWPWPLTPERRDQILRWILRTAGVRFGRGAGGSWHKFRRTSGTWIEALGGDGARHIGNTRKVFQQHYLDPRILDQTNKITLPRLLA